MEYINDNIIKKYTVDTNIKSFKVKTHSIVDDLLDGGFETGIVTTIYGPSSSGKTNLCIQTTVNNAKNNKNIIFIDSENGFSLKRVEQILETTDDEKLKEVLKNITLVKPKSFKDQNKVIYSLDYFIKKNKVDLIIVDSIGMLYRLDKPELDIMTANKDLSRQINILNNLANKYNIPIIITNQVYSLFGENKKFRLVGGDIIKYSSKCLIEMDKENDIRKVKLVKHRYLAQKENYFIITNQGLTKFEKENEFI